MSNPERVECAHISIEKKWDKPSGSVLPMQLVDEDDQVVEELICDSISGGRDEVAGMPRKLTLMKTRQGKLVGHAEYHYIKTLLPVEFPGEEGDKSNA